MAYLLLDEHEGEVGEGRPGDDVMDDGEEKEIEEAGDEDDAEGHERLRPLRVDARGRRRPARRLLRRLALRPSIPLNTDPMGSNEGMRTRSRE